MDIMKIFTILLILTIVILVFNLIKVDTNKNIEGFNQYNDECANINEKDKCITDTGTGTTCKWKEESCDQKINCQDITDFKECDEVTAQGKHCFWEAKDVCTDCYIDGCKQFNKETCEQPQEPQFKDKCKWSNEENEQGCKMKQAIDADKQDKAECWNFSNTKKPPQDGSSTCVKRIEYYDKCVSIREKTNCDNYTNAKGVKICTYQSDKSGVGGWCIGLDESQTAKQCFATTTEVDCLANNCKWDKWTDGGSCRNYVCGDYSYSGKTPPEDSHCEEKVGECSFISGKDNCSDHDITTIKGNQDCNDEPHCKIGGRCEDTKNCFTAERSVDEDACEASPNPNICNWDGQYCNDTTKCYYRYVDEDACEALPNPNNCKWDGQYCNDAGTGTTLAGTTVAGTTVAGTTVAGTGTTVAGTPVAGTTVAGTGTTKYQGQGQGQGQGQRTIPDNFWNKFSETLNNHQVLLQEDLPKFLSIRALLDKEEYLLRSLDSMGEKNAINDRNDVGNSGDSECVNLSNSTCPKKLVSRYNRIKLNLNYKSFLENESSACIVTINLNYKCGGANDQDQCNNECIWNDTESTCTTGGEEDIIQTLRVKEVTVNDKKNLNLESGSDECVDDDESCSYFILRKICSKKQYIDLYDQYTTKYFVADPNVDYNDMYLLQPFRHPHLTLQLKTDKNSDILILNELSGNKNEQFERI